MFMDICYLRILIHKYQSFVNPTFYVHYIIHPEYIHKTSEKSLVRIWSRHYLAPSHVNFIHMICQMRITSS